MILEALCPLRVRFPDTDVYMQPGSPIDLPDAQAVRLLAIKPDKVWPVLSPGDVVEWCSQALPKQRGEVLAVYPDRTFKVFHPLTQALCRLPIV